MIIGLLAKIVGPKLAPFVAWGLAALALAGALYWLRADAYGDGVRAERGRWEAKIAADKAAQAERERQADRNLRDAEAADRNAADQRKQEIDDATRNIPDQGLTDRQRARACLELMRQAKAANLPQPAC